jgi:DNA polymerase/3'-5' exonuclease PolX
VGSQLEEVAMLLTAIGAPRRRVMLYRRGAQAVRRLTRPLIELLHVEGLNGLIRIPAIGERLARAIRRLAVTGRLPILERLRRASASRTATSSR